MSAYSTAVPPRSRFFGAHAVRAAFLLALFGWGFGFYGPPIYLAEVVARTGWPLGLVSAAVTAHFLSGTVVIVNLPRAHARFGLAATTAAGAAVAAAGVLGWALASQPWQLFAAALVSGAGWVTMGAVAINAIVSRWYVAGRPAALGQAYNGASIGGVVFSPLWVAAIHAWGFAIAAATIGAAMILVVALLSRAVFSKTPESLGQAPDGGIAGQAGARQPASAHPALPADQPWRDRAFLTLALGMAIGLFAQAGLLAHLFRLLAPVLGTQAAGLLMGGVIACAIAGRAAAARTLARGMDRRAAAAASYGAQALGVLALSAAQAGEAWLIVFGVALFGAGIGNATSLPPLVAQADFAAGDVARAVALIVAASQATYAFAPACFGLLLQSAGSAGQPAGFGHGAGPFFAAVAAIQLMAAAVFMAGRRSRRP